MNFNALRFLALIGITIALVLSIWYTIKTYNEGNPKWIFLIMAFGIAILLTQNMRVGRRKD